MLMPTQITIQTIESASHNPFDLWQIEVMPTMDEQSFDLTHDDEAVWSISLSEDTTLAQKMLKQRLDSISQRQRAINLAGQYLQHIEIPTDDGVAFDLGQADDLTEAEDTLLTTIANHYNQPAEAESFAIGWLTPWRKPIAKLDSTLEAYQQFMQQVVYLLKPTLLIETKIKQRLLAQTFVRADGDMKTLLQRRVTPAHMALHQQTTHLTLETRHALTLFLAQVSAGAASLTTKFSVSQWVALPAAFRFAQDVMARAQEDQLLSRLKALQAQRSNL